ncbi:DUF397 domain-containing protein [Streptomyces sp. NPDC020742]|uniref:DUF397 domain-containing protein n=1 Tax=unclassified Streptomyces TaxID=2593676 RepID=UPI003401B76D
MGEELRWSRSSYSSDHEDACLELAVEPDRSHVHVRDSRQPGPGTRLTFPATAWSLFLAATTAD